MKKQLFLLVFLLPLTAMANDVFFNRLEKLHNTDRKKCLEVAKRYMNWFPEKAAPHYFASIIYQEKSLKSRSIQGAYRNVKQAVGHALQFEEKDDGVLQEQVDWETYKADLTTQAFDVVGKLRDANEGRYSELLMAKLERFDNQVAVVVADRELVETPVAIKVAAAPELVERVVIDANSATEFFGMPSGNEFVVSSSPQGEQQLLKMINAERKRQGMEPLKWDEDLARACRYHSYDLATQNYFNHNSYDRINGDLEQAGGTFDRIRKFYSKSFVNAENIAAGNESPEATYKQWFDSKGHYENMFNPDSRKVGLGVFYDEDSPFGFYWTLCTAL